MEHRNFKSKGSMQISLTKSFDLWLGLKISRVRKKVRREAKDKSKEKGKGEKNQKERMAERRHVI